MVVRLPPIPLPVIPPLLLAVQTRQLLVVSADSRKAPEAPTAPDLDGLQVGRGYSAPTDVLQAGELVQVNAP